VRNRRDQVQAHTFMVGRLVSALLAAEPDLPTPPLRRTPLGLAIGVTLGALAIGGISVFGIIKPNGGSWRKPGTLVVEKQTGTRYVLAGDRLHPVLNYASARLLLGADAPVAVVPTAQLAGTGHGAPVGIPDAPDTLPATAGTPDTPWRVCAIGGAGLTKPEPTGTAAAGLDLRIGPDPDTRPLSGGQALLVRAGDGTGYLAWGGHRLKLAADWVPRALGYDLGGATPVRSGWLNALPAGPDLGPVPVPGRGRSGPLLDGRGTRVGQLFAVQTATGAERGDVYLLTEAGMRPVGGTEAALILADPATRTAYVGAPEVKRLSVAGLAAVPLLPAAPFADQLPSMPPALLTDLGQVPCVRVVPGDDMPAVTVATAPLSGVDSPAARVFAAAAGDGSAEPADRVEVAPGSGMLARAQPVPGAAGSASYLVTEDGARYPVADADTATALGYQPGSAVPVPAGLLDLLPTGPLLSRGGDAGAS
jgi:type VII secretion protein EccB